MRFRWRWLLGWGYLLLIVLFIVIATYVSPCSQEYFGCLGRQLALLLLVLPWTLPILANVQVPWLHDLGVFLGLGIGLNFLILYRIGVTIDQDGIASSAFRRLMRSVGIGLAIIIAMIPLGKRYNSAQSRRQQLKETRGLGFQLYAPTFLPPGSRLVYAGPYTGRVAYAHYYEIRYLYDDNNPSDPSSFTIYQFKRPAEYHPPEQCGDFAPISKSELTWPCQLVDESEGNKIYYSELARVDRFGWFMAKGAVLVALEAHPTAREKVDGEVFLHVLKSPQREVLLHVLKSLQEVSPENLAAMKEGIKVH